MPKGRPTEKELESGRKLLSAKKVKSLIFSEGTYQSEIEVVTGDVLFPFLQMSDEGDLKDAFCSCSEDSSSLICPHLAATYVQIMGEENIPLHVRFRDSFWNQLGQMASRRHGYDTECLQGRGEYKALSSTGKLLFHMKPKTPAAKKKLLEIIVSRPIETEETSLKFFNLSTFSSSS